MGLELVGGRSPAVLTVEVRRYRYRRTLAIRIILTSCLGEDHRWNQPYVVAGVVENRPEARFVADAAPTLVAEPRRGLLLVL